MFEYIRRMGGIISTHLRNNFIRYIQVINVFRFLMPKDYSYLRATTSQIEKRLREIREINENPDNLTPELQAERERLLRRLHSHFNEALKKGELDKSKSIVSTGFLNLPELACSAILGLNNEKLKILLKLGLDPNSYPKNNRNRLLDHALKDFLNTKPAIGPECIVTLLERGAEFAVFNHNAFPTSDYIHSFLDLIHLERLPANFKIYQYTLAYEGQKNPKQVVDQALRCKVLHLIKNPVSKLNLNDDTKQNILNKINEYMTPLYNAYCNRCLEYLEDPSISNQEKYDKIDLTLLRSIDNDPISNEKAKKEIKYINEQIKNIENQALKIVLKNSTVKETKPLWREIIEGKTSKYNSGSQRVARSELGPLTEIDSYLKNEDRRGVIGAADIIKHEQKEKKKKEAKSKTSCRIS